MDGCYTYLEPIPAITRLLAHWEKNHGKIWEGPLDVWPTHPQLEVLGPFEAINIEVTMKPEGKSRTKNYMIWLNDDIS